MKPNFECKFRIGDVISLNGQTQFRCDVLWVELQNGLLTDAINSVHFLTFTIELIKSALRRTRRTSAQDWQETPSKSNVGSRASLTAAGGLLPENNRYGVQTRRRTRVVPESSDFIQRCFLDCLNGTASLVQLRLNCIQIVL